MTALEQAAAKIAALERDLRQARAEYGRALRATRRAAGMTLEQVAAEVGCSVSYVSGVERGRRFPLTKKAGHAIHMLLSKHEAPLGAGEVG